jgi:hypothetical protein
MTNQALQTEFEFTLPQGYVDDDGTLHKEGRMRLATAADEIQPLQDPQVQSNQSYLTITLLARVVTELGSLETVDKSVIEDLFVNDLEYLQAMYERVNNQGRNTVATGCPDCGHGFDVDVETGTPVASDPEQAPPAAEADGGEPDGSTNLMESDTEQAGEIGAGNPTE